MKRILERSLISMITCLTLILCFTVNLACAQSWVKGYIGANLTEDGRTSVAVDLNNNPVVSFFDSTNNDLILYRSSDGSLSTVDSTGEVGRHNSLAMNGNSPRIAYVDSTDSSNAILKYASWNGSGWDIEVVDSGDEAAEIIMSHCQHHPISDEGLL